MQCNFTVRAILTPRAIGMIASVAILAACSGDGSGAARTTATSNGLEQIPVIVEDEPLYEYHVDDGGSSENPSTGTIDEILLPGTPGSEGVTPQDDEAPAPEPGTIVLLGGGLAALAASRKRKKMKN